MTEIVERGKKFMQNNKKLIVFQEIYKDANTQVHTIRK